MYPKIRSQKYENNVYKIMFQEKNAFMASIIGLVIETVSKIRK